MSFETVLAILLSICGITTISALLLVIFQGTNLSNKIIEFLKKHRYISTTYVVMALIGFFAVIISR